MTTKKTEGLGQFWLASKPDTRLPGNLDTSDSRPKLAVMGGLTAQHKVVGYGSSGEIAMAPADEVTDLLIHGELVRPRRPVTILGGTSTTSDSWLTSDLEMQTTYEMLCGQTLIAGAHLPRADESFDNFRFRVSGMEQWFGLPATTVGSQPGREFSELTWTGDSPHIVQIPTGTLTVRRTGTSPGFPRDPMSTSITESVWLEWAPEKSWDLDRFHSDVAQPLRILMELVYRDQCNLEELQVRQSDQDPWLDVYGLGVSGLAVANRRKQYFFREEFQKDVIPFWLEAFPGLSPLPQLVSSTMNGKVSVLEVNALVLCSAVEGLHRRIHDGEKVEITAGPRAGEFRNFYFNERLKCILQETATYIPELAAQTDEWFTFVTKVRNMQAHQFLGARVDDPFLRRVIALADVIRWALTVRMVQDAGLVAENFHSRVRDHGEYVQLQVNVGKCEPALDPDPLDTAVT